MAIFEAQDTSLYYETFGEGQRPVDCLWACESDTAYTIEPHKAVILKFED
jgi:hypothetical protein